MKIKGNIEIIDVNTNNVVAYGENKFTNIGRQHICNWLLHDNYSDDINWNGVNPYQGGRSISDMKIIPYTQITAYKIGSHSYVQNITHCLYPKNNDDDYLFLRDDGNNSGWGSPYAGSYNDQYGTVFFEFSTPKNLAGIMIYGHKNGNTFERTARMQFSTSPNTFAENTNWTVQNIKFLNNDSGGTWGGQYLKNYQLYRFDYAEYPNRIINNVKTFRIRTKRADWNYQNYFIIGVWFLEANDYPNTPSVIAIGIGANTPTLEDTALQSESFRKFIRTHKTVNDNQIRYSMRLNYDEGNNITFKEIGLFVNPIAGMYIGGDHQANYCSAMVARGLFNTPWSKTSDQAIDVDYTLTLTN